MILAGGLIAFFLAGGVSGFAVAATLYARRVRAAQAAVAAIRVEVRAEVCAIWSATTTLTEAAARRGATEAEYALAVRRQRLEQWCADTAPTQE